MSRDAVLVPRRSPEMACAARKRRCAAARRAAVSPDNAAIVRAFARTLRDGAPLAAAGLEPRRDAYGGIGLFATRALPDGYTLALPRRMILSAETAARSTVGRQLLRRRGRAGGPLPPRFTRHEVLLAVLAEVRGGCGRLAPVARHEAVREEEEERSVRPSRVERTQRS